MENRVNAAYGFVNPNVIHARNLTDKVLSYLGKNGFRINNVYDLIIKEAYSEYNSFEDCREFLEIIEGFPEINTAYKRPDMRLIKDRGLLVQPVYNEIEVDYSWSPAGKRQLFSRLEISPKGNSLILTSKKGRKLFSIDDSPIHSIKLFSRRIE